MTVHSFKNSQNSSVFCRSEIALGESVHLATRNPCCFHLLNGKFPNCRCGHPTRNWDNRRQDSGPQNRICQKQEEDIDQRFLLIPQQQTILQFVLLQRQAEYERQNAESDMQALVAEYLLTPKLSKKQWLLQDLPMHSLTYLTKSSLGREKGSTPRGVKDW